MKLEGLELVLRNMTREVEGILKRLSTGITVAAELIKDDSIAHTPIDFGWLAKSAYTYTTSRKAEIVAEIGYTEEYAPFVHEAPGVMKGMPRRPNPPHQGTYWSPKGEPKFLQKALHKNNKTALDTIGAYAKIGV